MTTSRFSAALAKFTTAEAASWGRVGRTTYPSRINISGIAGSIFYPVTDSVTSGLNGGGDLDTGTAR